MKVNTNQVSCFASIRWTRRADAAGTETEISGLESHDSLELGERYHEPLTSRF